MPYKDKNSPEAKECQAKACRKYYLKNKKKYATYRKSKLMKLKQQVNELKNVPCADCHQRFPHYVMDFDHKDRKSKVDTISSMVRHRKSEAVLEEIKKCEIVCSNCHRIRFYEGKHYAKAK